MASSDYALSQYLQQELKIPVYANRTGLNPSFPCIVYSKRSSVGALTTTGPAYKTEVFTFSAKAKTKRDAITLSDKIYELLSGYNNTIFAVQTAYSEDYDELDEFWSIDNDFQCIAGADLPFFNPAYGDHRSGSVAVWHDKFTVTSSNAVIIDGENVVVSGSLTVLGDIHATISASVESASYATTAAFALNSTPLPAGVVSSSAQVLNGSGVYSSSAQLPPMESASYAATASYLIGGSSVPSGTVSSSQQIDFNDIQNKPTTIATASYVKNAETASFYQLPAGVVSSSAQINFPATTSFAQTASYALNVPALPAGLVSASAQIDFNGIQNKPSSIATASYVLNAVSASYAPLPSGVVSSSAQVLNGSGVYSASAQLPVGLVSASAQIDYTLIQNKPVTASYAITASYALNSTPLPAGLFSSSAQVDYTSIQNKPTTIATASYVAFANVANKPSLVSSSLQFDNADNVTFGQITASRMTINTLVVQTITSSAEYVTGSTIHGSTLANTHQFTGSVSVSGSFAVNGVGNGILTTTGTPRTITGTANQVVVTNGDGVSGNPTLSLPQSIATGSTPTFAGLIASSGDVIVGGTTKYGDTSMAGRGLSVQRENSNAQMNAVVAGYDRSATFETHGSFGTLASPTAVQAYLAAGRFRTKFFDGTSWGVAGQMFIRPEENWTTSSHGSSIQFSTVTNGSLVDGVRMTIQQNGNVGIGTTSPQSSLHIRSGSVGFVETLRLDNPSNAAGNGSKIVWRNADVANDAAFIGAQRVGAGANIALTFGTIDSWASAPAQERMRVSHTGNVGIGTTNPATLLDVNGDVTITGAARRFRADFSDATPANRTLFQSSVTNGATAMWLAPNGTSPNASVRMSNGSDINNAGWADIYITSGITGLRSTYNGTGASTPIVIQPGGATAATFSTALGVRFNNYGAGTLITDSSGNITATSDGRMKDISGSFDRGLEAIVNLSPKVYHWNKESGLNTDDVNVGLIAQEVLPYIPEAVSEKDGRYTMSDRPIIAALINAVKELAAKNASLEARLTALEG